MTYSKTAESTWLALRRRSRLSVMWRHIQCLLFVVSIAGCTAPGAITSRQADEIIVELKAIRTALENPAAAAAPPRARPSRATLDGVGALALGSDKAAVLLVEFTDFQCPFCKRHHDTTWLEIRRNYVDTGKVRFVHRDLPLPMHPQAESAALAARCANEQGKFWLYRDALFVRQGDLGDAAFAELSSQLGLDRDAFTACMKTRRYAQAVQADVQMANRNGLTGTPSFVIAKMIGGRLEGDIVTGAQPYANFVEKLDAALAAR